MADFNKNMENWGSAKNFGSLTYPRLPGGSLCPGRRWAPSFGGQRKGGEVVISFSGFDEWW